MLKNPFFALVAARSVRESDQLPLPFGANRTSPVASSDIVTAVHTPRIIWAWSMN
ncbi:hypothetical protein [Mycobacterium leprae]|uniref:hypothetical protein n=1 Tax=Mycobacterium leprae TaxID=1769 RepID=UPI000309D194|nr:hypothetical protein [Mycobacterium leprae]